MFVVEVEIVHSKKDEFEIPERVVVDMHHQAVVVQIVVQVLVRVANTQHYLQLGDKDEIACDVKMLHESQ